MADRYERDRYDRERDYGRDDRGMMERAGDEVRSWFGDDDAARRRERDDRESYRRGEHDRDYGREHGRPYGNAQERAWTGGAGERWREPGRSHEEGRPRQDWNMAASRPAPLDSGAGYGSGTSGGGSYGAGSYGGTSYGGDSDRGAQSYRGDDDRARYGGSYGRSFDRGVDRDREFRGGYGGRNTSRDYSNWNYQEVGSAASDYGYIGPSAGWNEGRGQFSGRGPKGYQRSDDRIREDVCDRLSDDPHIDASEIEIAVRNGEVTLAGSVRSREDKRHAEDVVENISGVREVNNSLRVNRGQSHPGDVIGLNTERGSDPISKT
jgi:osmotically-inducible protein OsmY